MSNTILISCRTESRINDLSFGVETNVVCFETSWIFSDRNGAGPKCRTGALFGDFCELVE